MQHKVDIKYMLDKYGKDRIDDAFLDDLSTNNIDLDKLDAILTMIGDDFL